MSNAPEFKSAERTRLVRNAKAQIAASTKALETMAADDFWGRERELTAIQRSEAFIARMHVKELRGQ